MFTRHHRMLARPARGILLAGIVVLGAALPAASASAQGQGQGLFDFLFGSPRRPPSSASSYADPNSPGARPDTGPRFESGPAVAYCVRLCDGRFFPIQRSSGANPAQVCSSFCPAARTKIFSGGVINHAVANDGSRYADLQHAFAYRDRVVADCSCNGKDAFGLVTSTANDDPTLRPGDIVATDKGFVAYNGGGGRRQSAEFTPIETYGGMSAEVRQRLAGTKIAPRNATPVPEHDGTTASVAGDRRVQLGR